MFLIAEFLFFISYVNVDYINHYHQTNHVYYPRSKFMLHYLHYLISFFLDYIVLLFIVFSPFVFMYYLQSFDYFISIILNLISSLIVFNISTNITHPFIVISDYNYQVNLNLFYVFLYMILNIFSYEYVFNIISILLYIDYKLNLFGYFSIEYVSVIEDLD
jgi:amino acid permease